MAKYRISSMTIEIDAPDWILHDNLKIFLDDEQDKTNQTDKSETSAVDVYCSVVFKKRDIKAFDRAKPIVKTPGTSIYEYNGCIHNLSGDELDIPSYTVAPEDWSAYTMYVDPEYNDPCNEESVLFVKEGILVALKKLMIAALAQKRGLMIHSSSILWNNKGIVFSAPAGTGKSTHAHLWEKLYGTPILDGDVTACRFINGIPMVYGLPWCGTSGEFMNCSAPLEAIVFLQQSKENSIIKLDFHEAFMRLTARCFLLPWNDKMTNRFLDIIQDVAACTDCYLLNCLPDQDAVELVKNRLCRS